MDIWVDGWMDMDEWKGRWLVGYMDMWQMDGWMDRWMVLWMDK